MPLHPLYCPQKPGEEPLEEKDEDEEEDEEDDGASTLSSGSEAQAFEVPGGGRAEPLPLNGDCKDRHRGTPGGGGHARDWHPPDERSPDKASERPPGPERRHTKACSPAESACQQLGTAKKDGGSCGQLDRAGKGTRHLGWAGSAQILVPWDSGVQVGQGGGWFQGAGVMYGMTMSGLGIQDPAASEKC